MTIFRQVARPAGRTHRFLFHTSSARFPATVCRYEVKFRLSSSTWHTTMCGGWFNVEVVDT